MVTRPYPQRWPWLWRCRSCGLGFARPQPDNSELRNIYGPTYYDAFGYTPRTESQFRHMRQAGFHMLLRRIESLTTIGRLLDVGSGLGDLLAAARARGWQAIGIEPNPFAVDAADHVLPGITFHGTIEQHAGGEMIYDAITCTDVLEHLRSPAEVLADLLRKLRPGGTLLVTTIDIDSLAARLMRSHWFHIHRDHLWYFNGQALQELAESVGFEVLACEPAVRTYSLNYVCHVLSHVGNSRVLAACSWAALRSLPQWLLQWPFTARDGLLLIARKPQNRQTIREV